MKDISETIRYTGCDDTTIDLFESQYPVPTGVSYNSYIIFDEKIAVMDTADKRASEEWKNNIKTTLSGKSPDYLIVQHLEPDHSGDGADAGDGKTQFSSGLYRLLGWYSFSAAFGQCDPASAYERGEGGRTECKTEENNNDGTGGDAA